MILLEFILKLNSIGIIISSHPFAIAFIIGAIITGSRISSTIEFIVKGIISLILLLIFSVYGSFISILFTIVGKRGLINWAVGRSYVFFASRAAGVTFKVEGKEYLDVQPAIFICNHQATVDILVLGEIFPKNCTITGKSSLKYVPFLNLYMKLSKAIFIDRKNHQNAVHALQKAAEEIKAKQTSVFIFPEGTRARLQEADLLPFKKGAFHMAVSAKIPIVPIVVGNYSHIYDSRRRIFKGGEIHIRVLPPIDTSNINEDDKNAIDELTNLTREKMLKTLQEISKSQ